MTPKPICVPCQRFYRPLQNGFSFIEGMPKGGTGLVPTGTVAPHLWQPYKLWRGDLWQCEGCGHKTIAGVAREPVAVQHMPEFARLVKDFDATFQVNDC